MIAHLEGILRSSGATYVVIDVNGVGYKVHTTTETIETAKADTSAISLYIHTAVRETAIDLFGFFDEDELTFFELLLSVSGIGPRSALSILNIADVTTLQNAILNNDSTYLTKVSGIGPKSAQKIVLELQGKLDGITVSNTSSTHAEDIDTLEALAALGYSQQEVRAVLKDIPTSVSGTNNRIKHALKLLGK